jgi:formylglycine-generating enzyme required for sulfatase activity
MTRYALGDTISPTQARFSEGKLGSAGKTVEVGSFQPNSFGLYDMHGNVSELVEDTWHAYHRAPLDGSVRTGTYFRVLRGGSWYHLPDWIRSAVRYWEENEPQWYRNKIGFRVARSLAP